MEPFKSDGWSAASAVDSERSGSRSPWVYQPTTLNGEPVEVVTTIDVNFTLSQ